MRGMRNIFGMLPSKDDVRKFMNRERKKKFPDGRRINHPGVFRNPDRVKSVKVRLRPSQLKKIKARGDNRSVLIRNLLNEEFAKPRA